MENMENKKCLNCGCSLTYEKRNNKFCGSSCAAIFNNKNRKGKYVYNLSETGLNNIIESNKINFLKKRKPKLCKNCQSPFYNEKGEKLNFCSDDCKKEYKKEIKVISDETKQKLSSSLKNFYKTDEGEINKQKLSLLYIGKIFSDESKLKLSISAKNRCEDINERIRLREIGRKGGFGKSGYTINGIYYQSTFEKKCFEFLEENKIEFEPHKSLPDSSKICDIYFSDKNIWIELDGINREKRKKWLSKEYNYWLDKLNEYKEKKLDFKIFYNYNEFIDFLNTNVPIA